jgi:hypothetical protein
MSGYKILEAYLQAQERQREYKRLLRMNKKPVFDEAKIQERIDYLTNTEDIDCEIVEPKLLPDK